MKKLNLTVIAIYIASIFFILSASFMRTVTAASTESLVLVITELLPNPDSDSNQKEFIEIYNPSSEAISLKNIALRTNNGNNNSHPFNDNDYIESKTYLIIEGLGLNNSGGYAWLEHLDYFSNGSSYIFFSTEAYPNSSSKKGQSWSLIDDTWTWKNPTLGEHNEPITEESEDTNNPPMPEETDDKDPDDTNNNDQTDYPIVLITEVLPNPDASEGQEEFIELYNPNTTAVSLEGYRLMTSSGTNNSHVFSEIIIPPGGYYTTSVLTLTNLGGYVWLENPTWALDSENARISETSPYPDASSTSKKGVSWSEINDEWTWTPPTAGDENKHFEIEESTDEEEDLAPCPAGKFRNPETNRCKNIVSTASSLLPCKPGQTRNPATNRCRSISSSTTSTLKPCEPGQERNPATNRCRKISSASSELQPCDEGEERNPETNRCRKVAGSGVAGVASFGQAQPSEINGGVLIVMAVLALAYGIYEYRLDLLNRFMSLRKKL